MKRAYIRPVYCGERLVSLALCRIPRPLVDNDIIAHFEPTEGGAIIARMAVEFGHATDTDCVSWESPINI